MKKEKITRVTKYCIPGVTLTPHEDYWQIRKIGLTAERVKKDPLFSNTRKRAREFAGASRLAQKIAAFLIPGTGIKKAVPRLTGALVKAIEHSPHLKPGCPLDEQINWRALEGFDFNHQALWNDTALLSCRFQISQERQEMTIHLPAYKPPDCIHPPPGITHYRVAASIISLDNREHLEHSGWTQSSLFPCKPINLPNSVLICKLGTLHQRWHMVLMRILWYGPCPGNSILHKKQLPGPLTVTAIYKCN